ncbi:hypothetical protein ACQKFK_30035 [Bacillus mycoides]|uniref:hypothetical protein n=1 Tax=Bacillus mycoides TaxID=1405 RepID=UPI001C011CA3|nr:hypothetical protein [Bacillus mycoides]MED1383778.1 hypothetical protein [Bacillus mycoides]QWH76000.1 hypothetical protein EXW59_04180 [Bacillus mycoides]QWI47459.1 hypothetical protein EXW55_32160 [Bacillus mycoides]
MKIRSYTLSYTIVAPSGEIYPTKEMVMYTQSLEQTIQLIEKEIQRRLGSGYHIHTSCIHSDEHSDYQLALF